MLVSYVPSQGDAWSYTLEQVSRYFENILSMPEDGSKLTVPEDLFAVRPDSIPDEFALLADSFFLSMIELLGRRTGELHLQLASEKIDKDFVPESFSRLYQRSVYQSLRSLLKRVITAVNHKKKRVPEEERALYQQVLDLEEPILGQFATITKAKIDAQKIRIHGDYHLGQVLFTGKDFVIIDLEGEPARPLGERRLKYSAFRDVAGMVRSFHYAVSQQFLLHTRTRPEDAEALRKPVEVWYAYAAGIFLSAYLETVDSAGFVPRDRDNLRRLLNIFLLEKAVYEVNYELNNRPDWLAIPIQGLEFTLRQSQPDS
jgi:maltose alpha-D-glucosyltransferase/alpha-amylase